MSNHIRTITAFLLWITAITSHAIQTPIAQQEPRTKVSPETDSLIRVTRYLEELTVSVNREPQPVGTTTQQVSRIGKEDILRTPGQSTADVLLQSGHVAVQKSQQGGGSPIIRGFEASRVLLVVDGIRMNNLIYRNGHLQNSITTDPLALEAIEVGHGPSSLHYGSDALGGVVLMRTRQPRLLQTGTAPTGNQQKTVYYGQTAIRYNSANQGATVHVQLGGAQKRTGWLTTATINQLGDLTSGRNRNPFLPEGDSYISCPAYVIPGADKPHGAAGTSGAGGAASDQIVWPQNPHRQYRSGYVQYDLMQKIRHRTPSGDEHLLNLQFSNTGNISRYDRLSLMSGGTADRPEPKFAEWYYGPQTRALTAYSYTGKDRAGADELRLTAAWQFVTESRHDRQLGADERFDNYERVQMITLNSDWIRQWDAHKLHAGADGMLSFLHSTADIYNRATGETTDGQTRYPDGRNAMHSAEVFATHSWQGANGIRLQEGLRMGYATTYSSVTDTAAYPFFNTDAHLRRHYLTGSLSASISWTPDTRWRLSSGIATGYRVPNIDNLSKVFDSKAGTVTVPNPRLRPEKTATLDLTANYSKNRFTFETTAYATCFFDALVTVPGTYNGSTSTIYHGSACQVLTQANAGTAILWGVSAQASFEFWRQLVGYARTTYTYGQILDGGPAGPLDHIPPLFGRCGLKWESRQKKFECEGYALFNGRKHISRYHLTGEDNIDLATTLGADGKGMPAWFTLNLRAAWRPQKNVMMQLAVENLLDTEYRVFASGINAPGRNFNATVGITF